MHLQKYWKHLNSYFSNDYSENEKNKIENDIKNNEQIPASLKSITLLTFKEKFPSVKTVDEKWEEISKEILKSDYKNVYDMNKQGQIYHNRIGNGIFSKIIRYAAVFLLITGLPYVSYKIYNSYNNQESVQKFRIIKVGHNERFSIVLSDGSRIKMDAGSVLKIPEDFKNKNRNVYLKGEAYFHVAHDTEHPFRVFAKNAKVRVIGTEFNIRAWDESPGVTVTVRKGVVALSSNKDKDSPKVFITKGKQSILHKNNYPTEPVSVNVDEYTSWKNNELHFKGATLREVLSQLERWYDYNFVVADSLLYKTHLTYHIKKTNVNNFLQSISIITNTNVVKNGQTIRLINKNKNN